jgi:hypothetical protein
MSLKRSGLKRTHFDQITARRLARRAFVTQRGLCHWCLKPMDPASAGNAGVCNSRTMTADHLQPVWAGGQTLPGNVVAACYECNQARGEVTNLQGKNWKLTIGDDTSVSPFEVLKNAK